MKRKFIPTWLFAFVLLAAASSASAQQTAKANVPVSKVEIQKQQNAEIREARLQKVRPLSEIESDIKELTLFIEAKRKVSGFNTMPYTEKLEKLEDELKLAKRNLKNLKQ